MSVTAVPLRPIKKGSLVRLWVGIGLIAAVGVGAAWAGTAKLVAAAVPPTEALAANGKRGGVTTTASGLQYEVLKASQGPKPTMNDIVLADYEGKLMDGEVFDSSARNGGPVTLPVAGMIPGFTEALQLMTKGSKYRFWIPAELAYGSQGAGDGAIPPDSPLIFDVELHEIAPMSAAAMGQMPPQGGQ